MKPKRLLVIFILAILFTVAVLAALFTFLFDKTTERQLMTYGQMALDSDAMFIDTILESTKDLLDSVSLDADISRLLNYGNVSASDLLTGLRRLDKYASSAYFIDSIYIYNRKTHTVHVSSPHLPEAVYPLEEFPDFVAAEIMKDYSGIKNMEPVFRSFNAFFPVISEIPYISFIRYNTLDRNNESNVIMVNIKQDILAGISRNTSDSVTGTLLITDNSGFVKVISGNKESSSDELVDIILARLVKEDDNFSIRYGRNRFIVCSKEVLNGEARIVFIADENTISATTRTKGYGATIIFLGILLGTSVILSSLLFRRIWKNNILQLESIRKSEEERQLFLETSKRSRVLAFLHSDSSADSTQLASSFSPDTVLVILAIDRYQKSTDSNNLKDLICNTIESQLKDFTNVSTTYENDERIILIAPAIGIPRLEELKEALQDKFNLSFSMFVSNPCTADSLPEAYEFLSESLSYRLLFGPGKTITVPMLEEHEITQYAIPDTSLKRLTEQILKLDITESLLSLQEILEEMSSCSYRSSQLCLLNLSVSLDDAISRLQINNGIEKSAVSGSLIYRLSRIESLDDVYLIVKDLLEQAEKAILQNKASRQSELVSEIIRITQEKCSRRDFSINTVAEELGMSAAYLGKVFKKATSISFSEFVLNERMRIACSMLTDTDATIDEIVYAAGFGDTPYFYKLFKKINGCTPVRFRQEHQSRQPLN